MSIGLVIGIFACIIVATVAAVAVGLSRRRTELQQLINAQPNFTATHAFIATDASAAIAIDEARQMVCLFYRGRVPLVAPFGSVLAAELIEDGVTVEKTNRSSQLVGAALGGIALGVPGMLIGGLSGSSTAEAKIRRCELRITIDDFTAPTHTLAFFSCGTAVKRNSFMAEEALKTARHWHGLLQVVIRRGEIRAT
jgi:hypothetical protein